MTEETRTVKAGTAPQVLAAAALITDDAVLSQPLLFLEGERIARVSSLLAEELPRGSLHLPRHTLSSGFLDVHVHGAGGRDVMEGRDAIDVVARALALHGATRFLATTVTAGIDHTLRALEGIADTIEQPPAAGRAAVLGIHLEGPFLSHAKRGVHSPELLQKPSITLFDRFYKAARGHIRLMTIAPELEGAIELIEHAVQRGVRVSLGHSDALAQEARAGFAAGAVSATHTFNAMRGLTQREPGMLGIALDDEQVYAELICDGVHTTPEAVRLWYRTKGEARAMLVTDGMAATGMGDGNYMLGQLEVTVKDGVALYGETLAGSVLTMDRAVANVRDFTGCGLPPAVRMASRNPARMLGLPQDSTADFNVFDEAGGHAATMLRGRFL